jgi:transposase
LLVLGSETIDKPGTKLNLCDLIIDSIFLNEFSRFSNEDYGFFDRNCHFRDSITLAINLLDQQVPRSPSESPRCLDAWMPIFTQNACVELLGLNTIAIHLQQLEICMELASRLGFDGHRLTAFAVQQSGDELAIPLNQLYKRGLPTCAKSLRRRIDTDLGDWQVVDGQSYLDAFGFKKCREAGMKHQFFEVKEGKWTYIVPALALMKAIFRPMKYLLAEMFLPHALDQQCRLGMTDDAVSVMSEPVWTNNGQRLKCGDVQPLFNWLMLYPSAFSMAGSVHLNTLHGRIGLTLPKATLRVVFKGLKVGWTLFVTEAPILAISAQEAPHFEMGELPTTTLRFERDTSKGNPGVADSLTKRFVVPLRQSGETALTDQEWERIEHIILVSRRVQKPFVLSQRPILDGILEKLATGKSWRQVEYSVGNWVNATNAFRRWVLAGTFAKILSVLAEFRNAP